MNNTPTLELRHLQRTFKQGEIILNVLKDINFSLKAGEIVALVGPSGSGKSTLLQLAGLLERPSSGEIFIQGQPCNQMTDKQRTAMRCQTIGYVYQFHHLLPEFDAIENVAMPLLLRQQTTVDEAHAQAVSLLEQVGLKHRLTHKPSELSGGERQRVAMARALVSKPAVVLADEPTGNLDRKTAKDILALLAELRQSLNMALLVVTHDEHLAAAAGRTLHMQDGRWLV